MKCQECKNVQDEPQVNPPGVALFNLVTKKWESQFYRAGIVKIENRVLCWFCSTPTVGRHL